jgi:riboflavin kinase/FMN adenylyltransferase
VAVKITRLPEIGPRDDGHRRSVAVGTFDGVHLGHRAVIEGSDSVLTFDPHPVSVVAPKHNPKLLTTLEVKAELIAQLGVQELIVIPFDANFAARSADDFIENVLVGALEAERVAIGENFRFGHRAQGDVELLTRLGRTFGYAVQGAPMVTVDDVVFSSTYIRACVDAGDVRAAAAALGRPHRIEGVVVRGDQRGRQLGFPTANLLCEARAAIPADGVYAAWLVRRGRREMAAVSIGTNPTFSGRERRVEAFVLDFDGDLYGERVGLDFVAHLREMRRYDAVEPLITQIAQDVADTRDVLS